MCMLYAVALAERDGDDIMVDVYESIHDELRAKKRALEREKEKVGHTLGVDCYTH